MKGTRFAAGLSLMLWPFISGAATLGEPRSVSPVGAPVVIQWPLTEVPATGTLLARIADEAEHARLGSERPAWADRSVLSIEGQGSERTARLRAVQSSSSQAVDFVVEFRSPDSVSYQRVRVTLAPPVTPDPKAQPFSAAPATPRVVTPRPDVPAPAPVAAPAPAPEPELLASVETVMGPEALSEAADLSSGEATFDPLQPDVTAQDPVMEEVAPAAVEPLPTQAPPLAPHVLFNWALVSFFLLSFVVVGLIRRVFRGSR